MNKDKVLKMMKEVYVQKAVGSDGNEFLKRRSCVIGFLGGEII